MLPGWKESEGAGLEFEVARQCDKTLFFYNPDGDDGRLTLVSASQTAVPFAAAKPIEANVVEETILEEAQRLIHGDRNQAYGHPLDDFGCTASLWTSYLKHKYNPLGPDVPELEPEDVGLMMVLLKISRQANAPKRDNLVDGCGYFGTVEMVLDEKARRAA
jgi:hypothetical protein